jgi:hypothetical protein
VLRHKSFLASVRNQLESIRVSVFTINVMQWKLPFHFWRAEIRARRRSFPITASVLHLSSTCWWTR